MLESWCKRPIDCVVVTVNSSIYKVNTSCKAISDSIDIDESAQNEHVAVSK